MMNEESLKTWEQENIELLTSREMGEWLHRRDMNARTQGEWEEPFEHNGKIYHRCNHCHISTPLMLIDNYCSYCGAVMRKGGEEE